MSFGQNKGNKFDIDDLDIKSCLNASFEDEGISVSEDLINRTLDAIRKHAAEDFGSEKELDEHKKPASFLRKTRILISAAAAVAILFIGINAIGLFAPNKSDQASPEYNYMDMAGQSEFSLQAAKESGDSVAGISSEENAEKYTGKDEITVTESTSETKNNMFADGSDTQQENDMKLSSAFNRDEVVFADIVDIEQADVKSITITSMTGDRTITLTEQEQVDSFYSIMGNHSFVRETQGQSDEQFLIEILAENRKSRIIIGSNYVDAETTDNDIVSHSLYSAKDQGKLLEDLNELLRQ